MNQEPRQSNITRFYLFLRDRDAKIVELFFCALNIYILILVITPPNNGSLARIIFRVTFQVIVTVLNAFALTDKSRAIRMISAIANTSVMTLVAVSLWYANSPHIGTYALLGLLAAFVCWKINLR